MREIKFRAWGMREKKYLAEGFHIFGETTCFNLVGQQLDIQPGESTILRINDVIIEQFTGLRDKNGREIYEGDIVTVDGVLYFVEWRGAGDWFIDPECDDAFMFTPSIYELEIIGTIHENPELLS
jgi:uncharacterized phage protein (TIGR01671 family)